jgi:hypothetical protein
MMAGAVVLTRDVHAFRRCAELVSTGHERSAG